MIYSIGTEILIITSYVARVLVKRQAEVGLVKHIKFKCYLIYLQFTFIFPGRFHVISYNATPLHIRNHEL